MIWLAELQVLFDWTTQLSCRNRWKSSSKDLKFCFLTRREIEDDLILCCCCWMPSRSSELPPVMHYDVRYYRYCDHSTATHSVRYQMYCETPKKHTRAPSRSGSSHDIRCAALHRGQCEGLAHLQLFDKTQFFFLHISAKITSPWSRWSLMKQDFSRKLASSWLIGAARWWMSLRRLDVL